MFSCGAVAAEAVANSALQALLNKQDAVLGPWIPGEDPLEDALQAFAGAPGGPCPHPWEAGQGLNSGAVSRLSASGSGG